MSDLMLFGVLRMPYEMAMGDELSRRQFYDRAQQAADRLEALTTQPPAPQVGWQPIETAPPTDLLLLACVGWAPSEARGEPWPVKVGGYWDNAWHIFGASWKPTHWMPLPAAPTKTPEVLE